MVIGMQLGLFCATFINLLSHKMKHKIYSFFRLKYVTKLNIGDKFACGNHTWLVTDAGMRTIAAIQIDEVIVTEMKNGKKSKIKLSYEEAKKDGWFIGPPYAVNEVLFDENDLKGIEKL
jgi:hypothetical protein